MIEKNEQIIPLYTGNPPGSESWKQQETENNSNQWNTRIIYNIVHPSLTVFKAPDANANGTAIIICPGGGFHALSMDSEGFDVAHWLNKQGVTCLVLKYRLIESESNDPIKELSDKSESVLARDVGHIIPLSTADALKSVEYVRTHAKDFNVNPDRIGIIGFSAGGSVAASLAYNYTAASRPDFVGAVYLQYDWTLKKEVPATAPPLFILAASNDTLGLASHSIRLYNDWIAAGKPAELILYEKGGHGFGMRKQNLPSDNWIERFKDWLEGRGLLKAGN